MCQSHANSVRLDMYPYAIDLIALVNIQNMHNSDLRKNCVTDKN